MLLGVAVQCLTIDPDWPYVKVRQRLAPRFATVSGLLPEACHSRWNPDGHRSIRQVGGHDSSRPDDDVASYLDAVEHRGARPEPHVVAENNAPGGALLFDDRPSQIAERMPPPTR